MLTKPIPGWILLGGTLLAACAGCVNAAGLIGFHHQALSHMSGTAAIFGTELARSEYCGLQNALATSYSGAVIRTTHITGIITDLGLAAGAALRGDRVDVRRTGLYALLALGFTGGSVLGELGYVAMGFRVLLFPAMITGTAGLGYPPTRFAKAGSKDPPRRLFDFSLLNDWLSSSRLGLEQDRETQHRVFWGASIRDDGRLRDDDR